MLMMKTIPQNLKLGLQEALKNLAIENLKLISNPSNSNPPIDKVFFVSMFKDFAADIDKKIAAIDKKIVKSDKIEKKMNKNTMKKKKNLMIS
jgi:hypothetical protein